MQSYKCIRINGKQVRLHRALMEAYIGRKLKSWELVHHIDGNKHNNELSNLSITTRGTHMKTHGIGIKTRFQRQYEIHESDLTQLYLVERLPIWKVAEIIHATYGSVFLSLKKHNIVRHIQPCCHCGRPSQSTIQDICGRCYQRDYQRMYRAKSRGIWI